MHEKPTRQAPETQQPTAGRYHSRTEVPGDNQRAESERTNEHEHGDSSVCGHSAGRAQGEPDLSASGDHPELQTFLDSVDGQRITPSLQASLASDSDLDSEQTSTVEPGGNGARGEVPPSLVGTGQVLTQATWSRKQRRVFRDCRAVLARVESPEFCVLRVDLTSAPGADKREIAYRHERLKRRVERAFGYPEGSIQHLSVRTDEGNGVLHLLWVLRWKAGQRRKAFWIPQGWLAREWKRIHGASVVFVKKYDKGGKSQRNLSRYFVAQYFAGQDKGGKCSIAYHSYSRGIFDFPMVSVFREFRKLCRAGGLSANDAYKGWNEVLTGGEADVGRELVVSMETIRAGWSMIREEKKQRRGSLKIAREKRRFHGLAYGVVSHKLEEALEWVAAGHTWRDAVPANGGGHVGDSV